MPNINPTTTTVERLARAAAYLREAVSLIEEVVPSVVEILAPKRPATLSGSGSLRPAITDDATFSVHWAGRTCRLGNTKPFKVLQRLARRPNQLHSPRLPWWRKCGTNTRPTTR